MTKSKIINIASKDNEYHRILFNRLEEKIGPNAPNFLNDLKTDDPNTIKEILFITENDEIEDMCFIKGYKDLKDCDLFFDKDILLNDNYLSSIEEILKELHNIETLKIHINNPKYIDKITKFGYENLGNVDNELILLKDFSDIELRKEKRSRR